MENYLFIWLFWNYKNLNHLPLSFYFYFSLHSFFLNLPIFSFHFISFQCLRAFLSSLYSVSSLLFPFSFPFIFLPILLLSILSSLISCSPSLLFFHFFFILCTFYSVFLPSHISLCHSLAYICQNFPPPLALSILIFLFSSFHRFTIPLFILFHFFFVHSFFPLSDNLLSSLFYSLSRRKIFLPGHHSTLCCALYLLLYNPLSSLFYVLLSNSFFLTSYNI